MGGSKITIADIPFFNHLDAGDIMAISQHLQALSFAAEDMLFYQGDPPNGLFLVTSGSVKTYVYAPGTTKKVVVKLVRAGDYLGEFGLLDGIRDLLRRWQRLRRRYFYCLLALLK